MTEHGWTEKATDFYCLNFYAGGLEILFAGLIPKKEHVTRDSTDAEQQTGKSGMRGGKKAKFIRSRLMSELNNPDYPNLLIIKTLKLISTTKFVRIP